MQKTIQDKIHYKTKQNTINHPKKKHKTTGKVQKNIKNTQQPPKNLSNTHSFKRLRALRLRRRGVWPPGCAVGGRCHRGPGEDARRIDGGETVGEGGGVVFEGKEMVESGDFLGVLGCSSTCSMIAKFRRKFHHLMFVISTSCNNVLLAIGCYRPIGYRW